jgi:hypothetical protein
LLQASVAPLLWMLKGNIHDRGTFLRDYLAMADDEAKRERSWQEITSEAARESDPKKLLELSNELAFVLDQRKKFLNSEVPHIPPRSKKTAG